MPVLKDAGPIDLEDDDEEEGVKDEEQVEEEDEEAEQSPQAGLSEYELQRQQRLSLRPWPLLTFPHDPGRRMSLHGGGLRVCSVRVTG